MTEPSKETELSFFKRYKRLHDCQRKQLLHVNATLFKAIQEFVFKEEVKSSRLLGLLLTHCRTQHKRMLAIVCRKNQVGKINSNVEIKSEHLIETSLTFY